MNLKERQNKILEILTHKQKVSVNDLSDTLHVSSVTIRKDLDDLAKIGTIIREHGYATLNLNDDINTRLAYHFDIKERIAKKAAESVHDGETIMIESGSCCALLALELSKSKKDITIITNSAFISDFIRKENNINIILLGGNYQKEAQVNVGPMIKTCIENIYVDQCFIGTDGFSVKTGFTGNDLLRVESVHYMSEHANKMIVITESNKFNTVGPVHLLNCDEITEVYTDINIEQDIEDYLVSQNIKVSKA